MSHASELPIRPSATVILLRDTSAGFEVLLVQRGAQLAFHGGAWVFPGGRVDAIDLELAGARSDPRDARLAMRAAQYAAVRETQEEAGLALALESLRPFSHWTTPLGLPRRFATWFFVAPIDPSRPREVRVDGSEIHAHQWLTPRAALALQARNELELPPPTYVSLSVLSGFDSSADVISYAREREPTVFVPKPHAHPEGFVSLYEDDAAYADGVLERPGHRHRLCMFRSGWRYECTRTRA